MPAFYPIVVVSDGLIELPEQLGTKEKFWVKMGGNLHLLKFGREDTGENWAEKIACEVCKLLDLPHAHYDLATTHGRPCVISPTMTPPGARLILGNELINQTRPDYDGALAYRQREHTVRRVLSAIARFAPPYFEAWDQFLGYLMLDALIGNTDRHHENWGLIFDIAKAEQRVTLAPTFDHASSLGRELSDAEREGRLTTKDSRYSVAAFAGRARSALYGSSTDTKPLLTFDAFVEASKPQKARAEGWLARLADISDDQLSLLLDRVPDEVISAPARRFASALLSNNRRELLKLRAGVK